MSPVSIVNQPLRALDATEMDALRASINEHGQQVPIVRQASTGQLIDGHHRMAVCAELGLEPVVVDVDVDDEKAEALRVELNTARRQMTRDELAALQVRLIRDVYPTVQTTRTVGGKGKASAVAKAVGERMSKVTGLPRADVTPTRAQTIAAKPVSKPTRESAPGPRRSGALPAETIAERPARGPEIERGTDLLDATKQQLVDQMCRLADATELQLGQAILIRAILRLNNPAVVKSWIEGPLSKAIGRHISIGAIRRPS